MNKNISSHLLSPLLAAAFCLALSPRADAGYVEPERFNQLKSFDFTNESGGDSGRFQDLVDTVTKRGGGIIQIKTDSEEYLLGGIKVSSDVHIRMEPGVRIRQDLSQRGANVFTLTGRNISVAGTSPEQKAVIAVSGGGHSTPDTTSFRAIGVSNANNFRIANIFIEENDSRFSTIMTQNTAVNGTIENITMTGAGPGWGLLQMQGGANIIARNLDGQGGFTLRLEQGSATDPGGIQNLQAENIIGRHARAAVLIAPKSKVNGTAIIKNVTSYGCQWAILSSFGKEGGVFEKVTIKGTVTAHYDDQGSQFRTLENKTKNRQFLPPDLQKKIITIPGYGREKFSEGPASGAVKLSPIDWVVIDPNTKITRQGFPFEDPAIVSPDYIQKIISQNGVR